MKNTTITKVKHLLLSIIIISLAGNLAAQDYKEKLTEQGIEFEYKWRKEKILVKDSPLALFLKITNTSDEQKLVGFELNYYREGLRTHGSGYHEYCLKPGQTIRGKRWKLAFPRETEKNHKIEDEKFLWEIENLNIEENFSCKTGLRLRLVPLHEVTPCNDTSNYSSAKR